MRLFKSKTNKAIGRNPALGQKRPNTPVIRYYRPDAQENTRLPRLDIDKNTKAATSAANSTAKRVFKALLRRSGAVLVLIALLINTTLSSSVAVRVEDTASVIYHETKTYSTEISMLASESIWQRTKMTFRSDSLEKSIRERFPEVDTATVVVPLAGRRLQATLKLSEPLVRYQLPEPAKTGIIGSNGLLLFQADTATVSSRFADLPLLELTDIVVPLGQQALTTDEADLLHLLKQEFDGSDSYRPSVKSIEMSIKKRELIIRFNNTDVYAKMTPEYEAREQVGALVATFKQLDQERKLAADYIDVRVEGRVFIR